MKNKENTKRKLLNAVGQIIRTNGFAGLGVNKVARLSGVSKILIYRYFGTYGELVKSYIREKDFWSNYFDECPDWENLHLSLREYVYKILDEQFTNFYNHCEMEALLVSEISNQNVRNGDIVKICRSHSEDMNCIREESCYEEIPYFEVVSTLLAAGTDHLILSEHSLQDINEEGSAVRKIELWHSIVQIIDWTLK